MLKSYKYRIYPIEGQKIKIDQSIDVCRLVYNLALELKIWVYRVYEKSLSSIDLCYQLPELKVAYPWMNEVNGQSLQEAIKKVDIAFNNFYRGAGYPKFKSRKKGTQSFQCPGNKRKIDWEKSTLSISKIYNIPVVLSRKFEGKIKTVTISRTPTGKYYASILVDNGMVLPNKPAVNPSTTIGIDVGIKSFVVSSNGQTFEPNRHLKANLERLKVLQRRTSKKKNGSKNKQKANLKVARLHEKISSSRLDYIHKVTTALIRDNQVESIVIENLNVSGLLANHKLAQAVSDVSWGKFFEILKYKCDWYGKNLIKIGRFEPSSKRCSECGHIYKELTLAEREWQCSECNVTHDRDINAARNIRFMGLNNSPEGIRGEPVEQRRLRRAKKQEN